MEGSCSYALRISIDAPNPREKVRREGHSAPLAASPRNEGILFGEHRDSLLYKLVHWFSLLDGRPRNSARRQLHRALVCIRSDP